MAEQAPLTELLTHLKSIQDRPDEEHLDLNLVEDSRFILRTPGVRPKDVLELADVSLGLLRQANGDLGPLARLLGQAIELVRFDDLQKLIAVESVTEGLLSPSEPIQSLSLAYLKKAAESPSGAAFVANDTPLVKALIRAFLTSESAEIGGTQALEAILALLTVDNRETVTTSSRDENTGHTTGQGLLWRRMFQDKEVFDLFYHFTSASDPGHGMSRSQITTAQARLLDLVSVVAGMRWDVIVAHTRTTLHVSNTPIMQNPLEHGLLPYASLVMVDRADPLMTVILIDFLTKLLEVRNPGGCSSIASIPATTSPALEFLVATGLHQNAIDYYLQSEQFEDLEIQLLGGAQIRYLCGYADLYPEHFIQNTSLVRSVIKRLMSNLQMTRARWAHGSSPVQDLHVLAHIPVIAPVTASRSEENPLLLIPTNPANADALETLGRIFSGPEINETEFLHDLKTRPDRFSKASRAASARLLFYQYHDSHPEFWSNVGAAMNVLAMPRAASSAIYLVRRILSAVWAKLANDADANPFFPSEESLKELCGGNVSETGVAEVLNAGEPVIQSLLTPQHTSRGDPEAAKLAWRLGKEKFDVTLLLSDLMKNGIGKAEVTEQIWQSTEKRVRARILLGRTGRSLAQTNVVESIGA